VGGELWGKVRALDGRGVSEWRDTAKYSFIPLECADFTPKLGFVRGRKTVMWLAVGINRLPKKWQIEIVPGAADTLIIFDPLIQTVFTALSETISVEHAADLDKLGTQIEQKLKSYPCNFFFKLVGCDFGYCGHYWPIVPAQDDR
jgi:hypothetical protein